MWSNPNITKYRYIQATRSKKRIADTHTHTTARECFLFPFVPYYFLLSLSH